MTTLPRRASRDTRSLLKSPFALIMALLVAGGAVAALMFFPREAPVSAEAVEQATITPLSPEERQRVEAWWAVQPKVELPIAPSAGVRVQIIKFSDYQCPGCRHAHDELKKVLAKYDKGVVEFVLKHYPLEPECNANVGQQIHVAACEAAAAYVMARGTGFQQRLDDWLFANQQTLTRDVVRQAAKDQAGISNFDERYAQALQEVKTDASLGGLLKVGSTPTVYVNGRMIAGRTPSGQGLNLPPAAYIDALIDIELKRAK
jgi:protein-disulfide isomerase